MAETNLITCRQQISVQQKVGSCNSCQSLGLEGTLLIHGQPSTVFYLYVFLNIAMLFDVLASPLKLN